MYKDREQMGDFQGLWETGRGNVPVSTTRYKISSRDKAIMKFYYGKIVTLEI